MWSPNMSSPVVKMLCHKRPVTSIAIDPGGWYVSENFRWVEEAPYPFLQWSGLGDTLAPSQQLYSAISYNPVF